MSRVNSADSAGSRRRTSPHKAPTRWRCAAAVESHFRRLDAHQVLVGAGPGSAISHRFMSPASVIRSTHQARIVRGKVPAVTACHSHGSAPCRTREARGAAQPHRLSALHLDFAECPQIHWVYATCRGRIRQSSRLRQGKAWLRRWQQPVRLVAREPFGEHLVAIHGLAKARSRDRDRRNQVRHRHALGEHVVEELPRPADVFVSAGARRLWRNRQRREMAVVRYRPAQSARRLPGRPAPSLRRRARVQDSSPAFCDRLRSLKSGCTKRSARGRSNSST